MATINVFIRKYKDNKLSPIVLEYSHLKKRWRTTTDILVDPTISAIAFDEDLQCFKIVSTKRLNETQRTKLTDQNKKLNEQYQKLNDSFETVKTKEIKLDLENVKKEFTKTTVVNEQKTVEVWYTDFIAQKEKELGSGLKGYKSAFEHFKKYGKKKGALLFTDLNSSWLEGFRTYLVKLELDGPTIHKQFRNLKIFLNWVKDQDETDSIIIPAAVRKMKVKARYGDPIGLSVDQFFEFLNFALSDRIQLEITRDLFVFSVSIGGPRHGDLKQLGVTRRKYGFRVEKNMLTYFERKTGNAHHEILLNKIGIEILEKYNYSLPHVPSNFRMNKNLKAIGKLLSWDEIKFVPKYDNYGKLMRVEEIPLKEIFSTKFMRKTAATIDNYLGVPTKTSMNRTGAAAALFYNIIYAWMFLKRFIQDTNN